ncbi:MAG TPA: hypothetical protein VNA04_09365, partial [Thermoanaerobaculia bacterium]|nr:hypothetical protein [Thermoanaerobaculia bacterium]
IQFEEPPVITPEQSEEWSAEIPGLGEVQIVIDPAAGRPPSESDDDDEPFELSQEDRDAIDRQLEEAKRQLEELRRKLPPPVQPEMRLPPGDDRDGDDRGLEKARRAKGKGKGRD